MANTTSWKLQVATIASLNGFANVVTDVHWRCLATDDETGEEHVIYGSEALPEPVDEASFIDLSEITAMNDEDKKSTVLGWAEAIKPGFVAAKEAQAVAGLEAQQSAPVRDTVALL